MDVYQKGCKESLSISKETIIKLKNEFSKKISKSSSKNEKYILSGVLFGLKLAESRINNILKVVSYVK